jgi:hypothetical protein
MGAVGCISTVKVAWKIRFVVGVSHPARVITEKAITGIVKRFLIQFPTNVKTVPIISIATTVLMMSHVSGLIVKFGAFGKDDQQMLSQILHFAL